MIAVGRFGPWSSRLIASTARAAIEARRASRPRASPPDRRGAAMASASPSWRAMPEGHRLGDGDQPEMAVAELVEHVEGFAEGVRAVGIEPVVGRRVVEQPAMRDERHVALAQIGDALVGLGDAR